MLVYFIFGCFWREKKKRITSVRLRCHEGDWDVVRIPGATVHIGIIYFAMFFAGKKGGDCSTTCPRST
jgi:hypothetical protein